MKLSSLNCIIILLLGIVLHNSCSPKITSTADNRNSFEKHSKIAILPFDVKFFINKSDKKNFTDEQMAELRKYLSVSLQEHLSTWLKSAYSKRPPKIDVLDINTCNEILEAKKISYASLFTMDKNMIPGLLGVDAVLFNKATFGKPMNQANANLGGALYGNSPLGLGLTSDKLELEISIHEGNNDSTLWQFQKTVRITAHGFTQKEYPKPKNQYQEILYPLFSMIDPVMKSFVKVFPYKDTR